MFKEKCLVLTAGLCLFFSVSLFGAENPLPHDMNKAVESNSIVYNVYDSSVNCIKGAALAVVATPLTLGVYAPYSVYKFGDVVIKKVILATSSATHFNTKSREDLEKETAFREITNRGAKMLTSAAIAILIISKFS